MGGLGKTSQPHSASRCILKSRTDELRYFRELVGLRGWRWLGHWGLKLSASCLQRKKSVGYLRNNKFMEGII